MTTDGPGRVRPTSDDVLDQANQALRAARPYIPPADDPAVLLGAALDAIYDEQQHVHSASQLPEVPPDRPMTQQERDDNTRSHRSKAGPTPSPETALLALGDEIARQDSIHQGYTATRDSLRLALATVEDEVHEALDGWREDRCKCGVPQCTCSNWPHLRTEALQAAAIIVRLVRAIDAHLVAR